jgi:hypothetical protein
MLNPKKQDGEREERAETWREAAQRRIGFTQDGLHGGVLQGCPSSRYAQQDQLARLADSYI